LPYRQRSFREQVQGRHFVLRVSERVCCLDLVHNDTFAGNIDIELVGSKSGFDHEVGYLLTDLQGGYSPGRRRLNKTD
jgi:hypothetical protein